jgi:hypothetical protein
MIAPFEIAPGLSGVGRSEFAADRITGLRRAATNLRLNGKAKR